MSMVDLAENFFSYPRKDTNDMKTLHQQRVESFMRGAKQHVPDEPQIPREIIRILRARLIIEEAIETVEALGLDIEVRASRRLSPSDIILVHSGEPSLVKIADGCADLSVVTTGTLSACGISDSPLLQEVDMNNLSKLASGHSFDPYGKLLKPPTWTPPRIPEVLQAQRKDQNHD